jgi:hypothetical protein
MVLQAYRAAKAANPALSYTAFNIIVDRQISLMEEGYKPEVLLMQADSCLP